MRVVHLMASPFFGGPERQMLGLARHLPSEVQSIFLSFAERGLARTFLDEAKRHGFEGKTLTYNTPRFLACVGEVADELRALKADVLCCSGYKPDLVGWRAARRVGIPVIAVAHGWTSATWKVRFNEWLDKIAMRRMDAVVCVSAAMADKVRGAHIPEANIVTIRNAIGAEAFVEPDVAVRAEMVSWFAQPPRWIIGAAGRLSPEKGFAVLVEAAAIVMRDRPNAGFVLFGDGPLRGDMERLIGDRGLAGRFVLAGFRNDLSRYLPNFDINTMSSFTEGLPVILLEAGAAGVPTVATSVGGIPEVIDDGVSGYLVAPGDSMTLAQRIEVLVDDDVKRRAMGKTARARVRRDFSFTTMAQRYHDLFEKLTAAGK